MDLATYVTTTNVTDLRRADMSGYTAVEVNAPGSATLKVTAAQLAAGLMTFRSTAEGGDFDMLEVYGDAGAEYVNLSGLSTTNFDRVYVHTEGGNDVLVGSAGNDYLFGREGNDIMIAGTRGNDLLAGYHGDDLFVIGPRSSGSVFVNGFQAGNDAIRIPGASLSGPITMGNGTTLTAGQVQIAHEASGGGSMNTRVYVGLNGTPGYDVTFQIDGQWEVGDLELRGSDILKTGSIPYDQITFDPVAYAARNADLHQAFGTNTQALVGHYIQYGANEGRSSSGFSAEAYAANNADLFAAFGTDTNALVGHYIRHGRAEGRTATGFDSDAYAANNADVFAAFGTNTQALVAHYVQHGRTEGRTATGFDALAYAANNADVFAAFGTDVTALVAHYVQHGRAEGRTATGFDPNAYAVLNPDVQAAFGTNANALVAHYVTNGRAEGRQAWRLTSDPTAAQLAAGGIAVG